MANEDIDQRIEEMLKKAIESANDYNTEYEWTGRGHEDYAVKEATQQIKSLLLDEKLIELQRPLLEQAKAGLNGKSVDLYFLLRTRIDELNQQKKELEQ